MLSLWERLPFCRTCFSIVPDLAALRSVAMRTHRGLAVPTAFLNSNGHVVRLNFHLRLDSTLATGRNHHYASLDTSATRRGGRSQWPKRKFPKPPTTAPKRYFAMAPRFSFVRSARTTAIVCYAILRV